MSATPTLLFPDYLCLSIWPADSNHLLVSSDKCNLKTFTLHSHLISQSFILIFKGTCTIGHHVDQVNIASTKHVPVLRFRLVAFTIALRMAFVRTLVHVTVLMDGAVKHVIVLDLCAEIRSAK